MFRKTILPALLVLLWAAGGILPAAAAEVESGSVYCFGTGDFSGEEPIRGICIQSVPEEGALMLGSRVLCPGDILTAEQVAAMTFSPRETETDTAVRVGYLPIYEDRVDSPGELTISIRGREDKAPVAEDSAVETYKNLPNSGRLKVSDPEGKPLTYTVIRQPKRGTVTIGEDGTFTYTPKKNKVGVDSFVYTATDPAGKVSREATVTITILKPTEATQYTDTVGKEYRFEAEWMKNTGIFTGEVLAGKPTFSPDKEVTRGEFLTMLVKTLDIPTDAELVYTGYADEIPQWLRPYLAAAVRSGLTAGLPDQEVFGPEEPITGAEAAVMLQNALDLTGPVQTLSQEESTVPVWAETALAALAREGLLLKADSTLTRGQTAWLLYETAKRNIPESVFTQ